LTDFLFFPSDFFPADFFPADFFPNDSSRERPVLLVSIVACINRRLYQSSSGSLAGYGNLAGYLRESLE
jgi:hypothetical protein